MLHCQGIQGIYSLALVHLVLCVPHLFMYSFYLEHLLLNKVRTRNPLIHPSRFSIITSFMKVSPNSQAEDEAQPLGHSWV